MSSARAFRLWRWASLPRVWRLARAPGAVRTCGALEGGGPARHVRDEASGVDRVQDDAGAGRRVHDAAHVEGPALGGAEADQEAVGDEDHHLAPRQRREALDEAGIVSSARPVRAMISKTILRAWA